MSTQFQGEPPGLDWQGKCLQAYKLLDLLEQAYSDDEVIAPRVRAAQSAEQAGCWVLAERLWSEAASLTASSQRMRQYDLRAENARERVFERSLKAARA